MKKLPVVALSSILTLASSVVAAENRFYVSADLVRSDIDLGFGIDDDDTTFGIGFGYAIHPNVAVEIGYQDFGEISVAGGGTAARLEGDAVQIAIIGSLPVFESAGFYSEIGVDMWDVDLSYSNVPGFGSGSASDDGTDEYFGFGGYVGIGDNVSAKFEYQFHEFEEITIDTLSLGVLLSF